MYVCLCKWCFHSENTERSQQTTGNDSIFFTLKVSGVERSGYTEQNKSLTLVDLRFELLGHVQTIHI